MALTFARTTCLALAALGSLSVSSNAQVTIVPRHRSESVVASAEPPHAHLRVDVSLVLIPVHVIDPMGASVTTLKAENFQIFEDGAERTITHFSKDDAPISIGLVFDSSGSMRNKMKKSSEAAAAFFKTANTEDEFFLVDFNERPKLAVPFTRDSDQLIQRIARARTLGRTSLLDAIHLALEQMKNARNLRKAIVILSDGGDNCSRYTAREIKTAMLESDVQVYAMGIFDSGDSHKQTAEELNGPRLLDELAENSGGKHFPVENLNDLPAISARIGTELRNQYVLGYSPGDETRDGKYRRVKVNIAVPAEMPSLRLYYRQGYYAAAQ